MSLKTKERPLISSGIGRFFSVSKVGATSPACRGLRTQRTAGQHTPAVPGFRCAPYGLAGSLGYAFFNVAMIGGYQHLSVDLGNSANQLGQALIQRLYRGYRCVGCRYGPPCRRSHNCTRWCRTCRYNAAPVPWSLCGAHLRLQVVGGHIG